MGNITKQQVANRARWVEALRSGRYTQGIERLREDHPATQSTSFCVWGVACDVMDPNGWRVDDKHVWRNEVSARVPNAMGIGAGDDLGCVAFRHVTLLALNDNGLASFDELADLIQWHTFIQLGEGAS